MPPHSEPTPPQSSDAGFDGEITHRIDSPHATNVLPPTHAVPQNLSHRSAAVEIGAAASSHAGRFDQQQATSRQLGAAGEPTHCGDDSLSCLDDSLVGIAHAEDLLDYIQRLSEDLDARSTKLNADIAIQERRERAFRLWAQQRSEELREQREECERERQQLKTQARRMALTDNDPASTNWYPHKSGKV
jgi:hypothetical protein